MSVTFGDLELSAGPCHPENRPGLLANVPIALADGTQLIVDLYVPEGPGPWPAVVERTCYGAAALGPLGACYAAHGYLFAAVDVRGRYRSGGTWDPLAHEKTDGPEVLRWVAGRPECDGRIGTRGHSYAGVNQLLAAPHAGDCLRAMVVCVAPGDPFENVPFQGGAYDISDFLWAWSQTGPASQQEDAESGLDERLLSALAERPLADLDVRLGLRSPYIGQWLRQWRLDRYWQARSWLGDLSTCRVPALHVSGWWDNNGKGSVRAFEALGGSEGGQRLILGPWDHLLDAPPLDDLPAHEQAAVARAALRDAFTDELAWFEQHLKGQPARLPPVELFLTGAWQWIEDRQWPPRGTTAVPWYLGAGDGLSTNPARRSERHYTFDPRVPNRVSRAGVPVEPAPYDTVPDVRDDVLVYRSQPLAERILAIGTVQVILEAKTTALDVDWVARLVDEYPDGRAILVRDGILRARFRHGFARPRLVRPGARATYPIDLWHVGHVFRPGHRLRVEICSSQFGRWDVNPGDGGDLAYSTAAVSSVQTVVHGGVNGSRLLLPQCSVARAAELLWDA